MTEMLRTRRQFLTEATAAGVLLATGEVQAVSPTLKRFQDRSRSELIELLHDESDYMRRGAEEELLKREEQHRQETHRDAGNIPEYREHEAKHHPKTGETPDFDFYKRIGYIAAHTEHARRNDLPWMSGKCTEPLPRKSLRQFLGSLSLQTGNYISTARLGSELLDAPVPEDPTLDTKPFWKILQDVPLADGWRLVPVSSKSGVVQLNKVRTLDENKYVAHDGSIRSELLYLPELDDNSNSALEVRFMAESKAEVVCFDVHTVRSKTSNGREPIQSCNNICCDIIQSVQYGSNTERLTILNNIYQNEYLNLQLTVDVEIRTFEEVEIDVEKPLEKIEVEGWTISVIDSAHQTENGQFALHIKMEPPLNKKEYEIKYSNQRMHFGEFASSGALDEEGIAVHQIRGNYYPRHFLNKNFSADVLYGEKPSKVFLNIPRQETIRKRLTFNYAPIELKHEY